jgi:hypothetical protein
VWAGNDAAGAFEYYHALKLIGQLLRREKAVVLHVFGGAAQ